MLKIVSSIGYSEKKNLNIKVELFEKHNLLIAMFRITKTLYLKRPKIIEGSIIRITTIIRFGLVILVWTLGFI